MSSSAKPPSVYDGSSRPKVVHQSQMSMILQLLPKIPLAARVALLHILRISPQSKYLDLTTAVTIAVLRSFLVPSKPMSITQTQKLVNRDPGIKGRIWVANYTAPASPGSGIRDALIRAINGLEEGSPLPSELLDRLPDAGPVEAEWTGYRPGVPGDAKLPLISEQEKYDEMMKEVKTPITVLYFHGGAYYLMDPCTHRPTTKKLAKETGGRSYSVRYRLAPQHPFPAAVMDALTSYLTLLHPPPGAFHAPVKPEHIIFAGDSAGGNLALALLQTILELNRQAASTPGQTIHWHGVDIPLPLPLPAGMQLTSPWLDMTHSSPSCHTNAAYDYLPALDPRDRPSPAPCPAWPASPPRKNLYVADELAAHPLVTLLMARSWAGAPPVYMSTGWELLADEDKLLAAKLQRDGVRVVFEEYQAMPHCFALMFKGLEESKRCWRGMTDFIKEVAGGAGVEGQMGKGEEKKGESSFTTVKARTLEEVPIEVGKLAAYEEGVMRERILNKVKKRVEIGGFDETVAKL